MPPDAASAADQRERDHDPDYRCLRCGHLKSPEHRYCYRCTRRIVKRVMRLFAQRRPILTVRSRLAHLIAQDSIAFDGHTDAAAMDADAMDESEWLGCWKIDMATGELVCQNEIPVTAGTGDGHLPRSARGHRKDPSMSSIPQAPSDVKTAQFLEILRRLQTGEISQAEADRQADALNKGAAYLRDEAMLIQPKRTSRMYK